MGFNSGFKGLKTVHLGRRRVKEYTYSKTDSSLHSPLVVVYVK